MLSELRYALRRLRRSPASALAAVLTLALVAGAGAAIFSVVDARAAPAASVRQRGVALITAYTGGVTVDAAVRTVGPRYFALLRTAVLSGREFNTDDDPLAPPRVMVSRSLARALWLERDASGQRVRTRGTDPAAFLVAGSMIFLVALLAAAAPARRAAASDPIVLLNAE